MKGTKLFIMLASVLAIGLIGCGKGDVSDVVDQTANVVQATDENVLGVKEGTNSDYSGVTYGEAFEAFFGSPTWKYFVGTQEGPDDNGDGEPDYTKEDLDIVEFTGYCTYSDVEVKALIQFTLDKEAGTFDATYLSFNDVPQSTLMMRGLVDKAFTSYLDENSTDTSDDTDMQETIGD